MTPERLDDATLDLQERARRFTDEVLIPLEVEAEMADGKLPAEAVARVKAEALAAGLTGGLHAKEHGGQEWTRTQWALVAEQFGRSTNA
ncbi:MAG TPA: acyl-CoA dehydrogenase family protein, partial [Solirubrobacterales bacterium]|nr:acyl-CoA dehydrogenase family protein [Solirubrobacterales bacterium]